MVGLLTKLPDQQLSKLLAITNSTLRKIILHWRRRLDLASPCWIFRCGGVSAGVARRQGRDRARGYGQGTANRSGHQQESFARVNLDGYVIGGLKPQRAEAV
ncbi:hypothetical protein [Actinomadura sp. 9N407]|uniref:hypothetical protein n=1 Tax=Actinomadura sp. 9N407 TaxID=3375154 RepID=UPI003796D081